MTPTPREQPPFRCGDTVFHRPSGETWEVAYCDGNDLAWCGWPNGLARTEHCQLVKACSDEEHAQAVERWRQSLNGGSRRAHVLHLYDATRRAEEESGRG